MQNGMLPIALSQVQCKDLSTDAEEGMDLEIDLERQEIHRQDKPSIHFAIDPFRRHCLLNGLDDISLTLQKEPEIAEFEKKRMQIWPWLDGVMLMTRSVPALKEGLEGNLDW